MELNRRLALLLPLSPLVACGGPPPAPPLPAVMPGPIGYRYLTPLRLNVASIEVDQGAPVASIPVPVAPAEAMAIMARDRLVAVGQGGQGRFVIQAASLLSERLGSQDRLTCTLRCRLEVISPEGARVGFAEAQALRTQTLPGYMTVEAADLLLRQTMDDLNVEFEYQVRRSLRDWLQAGPAEGAPGPSSGPASVPPSVPPVREEPLPPAAAPARPGSLPPPVPIRPL
ncbi:hypothetical protein M0638_13790 [Roseomonas sp. NAR14]|uniref:Lipoprotein n=1 Tax=Roseomonas acroporae TaxID=2937791 RepID=A0A9X2BUG4_9PROT|nr:hypothetical protein [Roseomonas acroporae]MCK8785457.1 hypothetical protein [Roseomonas acroporae]